MCASFNFNFVVYFLIFFNFVMLYFLFFAYVISFYQRASKKIEMRDEYRQTENNKHYKTRRFLSVRLFMLFYFYLNR